MLVLIVAIVPEAYRSTPGTIAPLRSETGFFTGIACCNLCIAVEKPGFYPPPFGPVKDRSIPVQNPTDHHSTLCRSPSTF
ncbi:MULTISPECIES: hypothetical protein [unclassified Microcoleus]|uniref:hypothetical protein n=1 Tax=unclassified Microcoleus TaxID=2642155 RepID=UPI002FD60A72